MSEEQNTKSESRIEDFLLPEKDTVDLVLPSGLPVTFRRPSLAFQIALNRVPGRIANAILEIRNGVQDVDLEHIEPTPEEQEHRARVAIVHCLVKPKFSFEPTEGEYDVRRVLPQDMMRVLALAMKSTAGGGGLDLESFREKSTRGLPADLPRSEGVEQESIGLSERADVEVGD